MTVANSMVNQFLTQGCARPMVGVYGLQKDGNNVSVKMVRQTPLPDVFKAPIRADLVNFVHNQLSRNRRQPFAVSRVAGKQVSAQSWGTGRAVARIPRVRGSGTHRSGQGAYGNMCRGGHMFNPTTVWRKWYRRVNRMQRRHAVVSAIAATALPALVFARGHRISEVPELPLVFEKQDIAKTKSALEVLRALGLSPDLDRCKDTKKIRVGKGKMRNRRYQVRKGPLIVHNESADSKFVLSFRNIPGVDLLNVDRLNILQLCPGGHVGRLIVWTSDAFNKLSEIYPDQYGISKVKKGYSIPHSIMTLPDISRIINSNEVQRVLRPKKSKPVTAPKKINPLKHKEVMAKLNPYLAVKSKSSNKTTNIQQQINSVSAKIAAI